VAPKRRTTTRKKADAVATAAPADAETNADAVPKRRTARKKADPA
jgi:hypothetical protein